MEVSLVVTGSERTDLAGDLVLGEPQPLALLEIGADQNSTVFSPLPIDIIGPFLSKLTDRPD